MLLLLPLLMLLYMLNFASLVVVDCTYVAINIANCVDVDVPVHVA
jgi:hypothetical protein